MSLPDSNTWYRLTNAYTGTGLFLSASGTTAQSQTFMSTAGSSQSVQWQFSPSGSNYYLRNKAAGPNIQLGYFFNNATSVPMPELETANPQSSSQKWSLRVAGSGFGIANVGLGDAVFLDTYSDTYQPFFEDWGHSGQIWTFNSVGSINDVQYSTNAGSLTTQTSTASVPTTTAATSFTSTTATFGSAITPSTSSSPKPSSLSSGAVIGIGVGAALGGIAIAIAIIFFVWRRISKKKKSSVGFAGHINMPVAHGNHDFGVGNVGSTEKPQLHAGTTQQPTLAELPQSGGYGNLPRRHLSELDGR